MNPMNPLNDMLFSFVLSDWPTAETLESTLKLVEKYNAKTADLDGQLKAAFQEFKVQPVPFCEPASLDRLDNHGYSLLHYAVVREQLNYVALLIKYGANVNQYSSDKTHNSSDKTHISDKGDPLTPAALALSDGIWQRDFQDEQKWRWVKSQKSDYIVKNLIAILLTHGAEMTFKHGSRQYTLLHMAAVMNYTVCIRTLMSYGADPHTVRIYQGRTQKANELTEYYSCSDALNHDASLWNIHHYFAEKAPSSISSMLSSEYKPDADFTERLADFTALLTALKTDPIKPGTCIQLHLEKITQQNLFLPNKYSFSAKQRYRDELFKLAKWGNDAINRCVKQYIATLQATCSSAQSSNDPKKFDPYTNWNNYIAREILTKINQLPAARPITDEKQAKDSKDAKSETKEAKTDWVVATGLNPLNELLFQAVKEKNIALATKVMAEFKSYNEKLAQLNQALMQDYKVIYEPRVKQLEEKQPDLRSALERNSLQFCPQFDIDALDQHGLSAMHYAAYLHQNDMITLLLAGDARTNILGTSKKYPYSPLELSLSDYQTILHLCKSYSNDEKINETITLLLESGKANPDFRAHKFRKGAALRYVASGALHYAAAATPSRIKCYHTLMSYGANPYDSDFYSSNNSLIHKLKNGPSFWHVHQYLIQQDSSTKLNNCLENYAALINALSTSKTPHAALATHWEKTENCTLDNEYKNKLSLLLQWTEKDGAIIQRCLQHYTKSLLNRYIPKDQKNNYVITYLLDNIIGNNDIERSTPITRVADTTDAAELTILKNTNYQSPISQPVHTSASSSSSTRLEIDQDDENDVEEFKQFTQTKKYNR